MADREPARPQRPEEPWDRAMLLKLARHGAFVLHDWYFNAAENIDEIPPDGHTEPFDACAHPQCALVRQLTARDRALVALREDLAAKRDAAVQSREREQGYSGGGEPFYEGQASAFRYCVDQLDHLLGGDRGVSAPQREQK